MKLQRRLVVLLVFIGALAVTVQIGFIVWRNYSLQVDRALDEQNRTTQIATTTISNFIEGRTRDLTIMAEALNTQSLGREQQQTLSQRWLTQQSAWSDLRLWDVSGTVLLQVSRPGMVINPDLIDPDEYLLPAQSGQYYYSPLRLNTSNNTLEMTIAVPVTTADTNQVQSVLAADITLQAILTSLPSNTYILTGQGLLLADNEGVLMRQNTRYLIPERNGLQDGVAGGQAIVAFRDMWFGNQHLVIVAEKPTSEVFQGFFVNAALTFLIIVVVVLVSIALALVFWGRWFARIRRITEAAQLVQGGDLSQRLPAEATDELGDLARAFNAVVQQFDYTRRHIDAEVQERIDALQTVVELNTRIATILNLERLLQDVVDLVKDRFGVYHAHIYLLNADQDALVLTAGSGYIGELMVAEGRRIDITNEHSIVAGAARSRRAIVANDVAKSPDFLPHPLLPETQAEVAFGLVARGQLLGVLDVQSNQQDFFTEDLVGILGVAATQVATAISNARLFETVERIGRREQALGNISRSIEGATTLEDILQVTVRELGKALRVPYAAIELQLKDKEQ